jgi:2-keto-3-deoxy-galactonokinase
MNDGEKTGEDLCAIYVDMGTTNTRVWLMRGDEVLARACKPVATRRMTDRPREFGARSRN